MARASADCVSVIGSGDEGLKSNGRIGAGIDGGGAGDDDDDELNQLRNRGSFLGGGGASIAAAVAAEPLA